MKDVLRHQTWQELLKQDHSREQLFLPCCISGDSSALCSEDMYLINVNASQRAKAYKRKITRELLEIARHFFLVDFFRVAYDGLREKTSRSLERKGAVWRWPSREEGGTSFSSRACLTHVFQFPFPFSQNVSPLVNFERKSDSQQSRASVEC